MDLSEIFPNQEMKIKRYVLPLYYFLVTILYTIYQIIFFNTILKSSILSKISLWDNFLLQLAIFIQLS